MHKRLNQILLLLCFLFLLFSCGKQGKVPTYLGFNNIDLNNNKVTFMGDTQQISHWEFWREVNINKSSKLLREIVSKKPAFVIHLGDLVTYGSLNEHWKIFDEIHSPLITNQIAFFPIFGNHDYSIAKEAAIRNYFSHFPYLKNQKWYSFTFRNVGFLMLDGNYKELSESENQNQVKWYQEELKKMETEPEIKFIIACCHQPPFTNSRSVNPSVVVRKNFAEPFQKCKKTAIFFSGHCHSYEKFLEGGKYFIVSGGGGGHRQKLQINKKKRKFNDLFDGPALRFFHFCEMTIYPDKLIIDITKLNDDNSFSNVDKIVFQSN